MADTKLRRELLDILLGDTENFHSGGAISAALGLTRSAVWKEVQLLRDEGYVVDSVTNKGYRVVSVPDKLSAPLIKYWLDAPREQPITYLPEVDSTNLHLQRMAFDGAPEGSVVVAGRQTAGRGRLGRDFFSPEGGLYLSYLVRPAAEDRYFTMLTSLVGLQVCETLLSLGVKAGIKWPNDIIVDNRKVCGILTNVSSDAEAGTVTSAVVGIGINVGGRPSDFPEELRDKATSMEQCRKKMPCAQLAAMIITALDKALLEERWLRSSPAVQVRRLRELCCIIGNRVTIVEPTRSWEGTVLGISEAGGLVVTGAHGTQTVTSGEVSVRGMLGYK